MTAPRVPFWFGFLGLAAVVGLSMALGFTLASRPGHLEHRSTALKVEQVRRLASLTTLRVPISDVLHTELSGYLGGVEVVLLVRGDVDIATDLERARLEGVSHELQRATLVLPRPAVQRPRLDHRHTRVFATHRRGLWSVLPGAAGEPEVVDRAMARAQESIAAAADRPELVDQAKSHAQRVLERFFEAAGWSVRVRWED